MQQQTKIAFSRSHSFCLLTFSFCSQFVVDGLNVANYQSLCATAVLINRKCCQENGVENQ